MLVLGAVRILASVYQSFITKVLVKIRVYNKWDHKIKKCDMIKMWQPIKHQTKMVKITYQS